MIYVVMSPFLYGEGCRTRPVSIVVGNLCTYMWRFVAFCLLFHIKIVLVLAFFSSSSYFLVCKSPGLKTSLPCAVLTVLVACFICLLASPPVLRIRIHEFLGLQGPDPLVRGMDPDPDPALDDPDLSIIMQK